MNPLRQSTGPKSAIVITSKAAQKDLQNIQSKHDEMVMGMQEQAMKVAEYNANKAAEALAQTTMKNEASAAKGEMDFKNKQNDQNFALKAGELDVKRQALNK